MRGAGWSILLLAACGGGRTEGVCGRGGRLGTDCVSGLVGAVGDTGSDTGTAVDTHPEPPAATWPADLLPLGAWKLTLPVGMPEDPERPWEVLQPELATFALEPWFHLDEEGRGVRFAAHVGGVTTEDSIYPRSELREMTADGAELAAWSTVEGVHTLTITQAITHLPAARPDVVVAQIHDGRDDVLTTRLVGTRLYVRAGEEEIAALDPDYTLGQPFTLRFVATGGWIEVYYEDFDVPVVRHAHRADTCFFKAGVYTQSNLDWGESASALGAVEIHALSVTHE